MGYPVSKGNSVQFTVDGEKLAFAVVQDEVGYSFGLFKFTGTEWQCPIFGTENGFIHEYINNDFIMGFGSVAEFIKAQFPEMHAKLNRYINGGTKPDQSNKPECVGYDLSRDVDFDAASIAFKLNKEPPLSHAR